MTTNKEVRPILKIELNTADRILEIVGWLVLLLLWALTLLNFAHFPDTIPTHYDFTGQPDSFGTKSTIFILPLVGTLLFVGMTILNKYPHVFNYPVKITNQNASRQYTIATKLIRYIKLIVVLAFFIIVLMTSRIGGDKITGLGIWFIPLFIGLIYIPMIYAIAKLFRIN